MQRRVGKVGCKRKKKMQIYKRTGKYEYAYKEKDGRGKLNYNYTLEVK